MSQVAPSICTICQSKQNNFFLQTTDYSHTQERFVINYCNNCKNAFTVNPPSQEQIGKYYAFDNYISHSNTNKGFINKLYLYARNYSLKQKLRWIKKLKPLPSNIADVGAGTGAFVQFLNTQNINCTGFEPAADARVVAMQAHETNLQTMEAWFTENNTYDAITLWHVLEHLHNLDEYFKSFYNKLNNKGWLIIAVPNFESIDALHYKSNWAAYDVPRHLYHFSEQGISNICNNYNLEVKQIKPMWLDGYYVSLLSEQYKKGNKLKAVWHGLKTHIALLFNPQSASSLVYFIQKKD
jgi:2-polyprenyl-3-methyl-5-hydroxy-6-metoxy-1,4-benzoquinol methylase